MRQNDGGQAFPLGANEYGGYGPQPGMSLRDYFAAAAMSALLSNKECNPLHQFDFNASSWAGKSYKIADAMLAEREK